VIQLADTDNEPDLDIDVNPIPAGCSDAAVEAEYHLIACCLNDGEIFDGAATVIGVEDFLSPCYAAVWRSMTAVRGTANTFDLGSIFGQMIASERQYRGDFHPTLQDWLYDCITRVEPVGARWRWYAKRVRQASILRQLRHTGNKIVSLAESPHGPPAEMVASAEREVIGINHREEVNGPVVAAVFVREALARIESRIEAGGQINGLETGYPDIDKYLNGMKPGQLIVLAGRPGGGKTSLATNIAVNVSRNYGPVLFFSVEMPREELAERIISLGSGVPASRLSKGRLNDEQAAAVGYQDTPDGVAGLPIWINDDGGINYDRILSWSRTHVRRHRARMLIVDYLQLVTPENGKENRTQQVGTLARRMREVARECRIPMLLLSQLNREIDTRAGGEPMLSDLRDSGEIEQHANGVVMLWPEPQQADDAEVWTINGKVAKNRGGPCGKFQLAFRRPTMRFENKAVGY